MRIKTFQGRSLEEILPEVREELGSDAVVLGHREVINGGIGGFFGKRVIEVTAADQMPNHDQLIAMESSEGDSQDKNDESFTETVRKASSRKKIDTHDDWDPSADAQLAEEYDNILKQGAAVSKTASGAYEPMDLPRRQATQPANPQPVKAPEPQEQARILAARAHQAIAAATKEIETQLSSADQTAPKPPKTQTTLRAAVVEETPTHTFPNLEAASLRDIMAATKQVASVMQPPQPVAQAPVESSYLITPEQQTITPGVQPVGSTAQRMESLEAVLYNSGVDRDLSMALISRVLLHRAPFVADGVSDIELTREVMAEMIRVETGWIPLGRAHRLALVGPSGAGKSTMAAKLADGYSAVAGLKVGVVCILTGRNDDASRQNSNPLMSRSDLDVAFAANAEQALIALQKFQDRDLVLIDTPSSACLDVESRNLVSTCFAAMGVDDVHLVLPLSTSLREAVSLHEHMRNLGTNRLVLTKLDESRFAGQIINLCFRLGLPITYLSDGPSIPADIHAAGARAIAGLVIPETQKGEPA